MKDTMKKLTVLAALAVITVLGAGRENETVAEDPVDVTVKIHEGKAVVVRGLPPGDPAVGKIRDVVDFIFEDPTEPNIKFKNYVKQHGLIITVEDVPEYNLHPEYCIIDEDEFATRYEFVSTKTVLDIANELADAVNDMTLMYNEA
jgi:hypothetical protein